MAGVKSGYFELPKLSSNCNLLRRCKCYSWSVLLLKRTCLDGLLKDRVTVRSKCCTVGKRICQWQRRKHPQHLGEARASKSTFWHCSLGCLLRICKWTRKLTKTVPKVQSFSVPELVELMRLIGIVTIADCSDILKTELREC